MPETRDMLFSILLERIAIMALLMAVGVYLSRKGFLSEQGSRDLGAILLRIIIPASSSNPTTRNTLISGSWSWGFPPCWL